jgi:hypothetical protein
LGIKALGVIRKCRTTEDMYVYWSWILPREPVSHGEPPTVTACLLIRNLTFTAGVIVLERSARELI